MSGGDVITYGWFVGLLAVPPLALTMDLIPLLPGLVLFLGLQRCTFLCPGQGLGRDMETLRLRHLGKGIF